MEKIRRDNRGAKAGGARQWLRILEYASQDGRAKVRCSNGLRRAWLRPITCAILRVPGEIGSRAMRCSRDVVSQYDIFLKGANFAIVAER